MRSGKRTYIRSDGTIDHKVFCDTLGIPMFRPDRVVPSKPDPYDVCTITAESDPNGTDVHTPGAHLDHGKPQVMKGAVYSFPHALEAVARLTEIGAAKYAYDSWKSVPDGADRYRDSAGRHDIALAKGEQYDPQTGIHHLVAVVWDRLAELELRLRAGAIAARDPERTPNV